MLNTIYSGLLTFLFLAGWIYPSKSQVSHELKKKIQSIESITSKPDSAYSLFLQTLNSESTDSSKLKLAELAYKLGNDYYLVCDYRHAVPFLKKSAETYFQLNDSSNYAWSLHLLAITQKYWGHYREALRTIQTATNIFEHINDESGIAYSLMVEVYINEAWGRFDQIDQTCHDALNRFKKLKVSNGEAFCLLALGNLHLENNLLDSAWNYYTRALNIFEESKSENGTALVIRDKGRYWLKKNDPTKALSNLNQALQILESINNKRGISEIEMLLGGLFLNRGAFEKAIQHLEKGQKLAKEIELAEDMVKNYKQLAEAYDRIGDKSMSLKNFIAYTTLKDSIFNAEKHLQLADMQTKYETEKKEQQIALQSAKLEKNKAELSKQKIFILSLSTGLFLFLILSFMIYQLYRTKKRDNVLLANQKKEIENKNKQITDSITYAKRIQNAVLSTEDELREIFPQSFILFKPKDIVSGDFFYFRKFDEKILIAAADCTGHGVPGAFMSMLGTTLLNEILGQGLSETPAAVLETLRVKAKAVLHQSSYKSETKDGMEMALCIYNEAKKTFQFAGAGNPLYQIRKGELMEAKGTRSPIGIQIKEYPFENKQIDIQEGDCFYLFSDGFADQMGGARNEKVKIKEFKNLLVNNSHKPLAEQKQVLYEFITTWMEGYDQTDDILVMGFRI